MFLSSSSARCCPAVPEPLLEPSTLPGAVIIGVRALALAPYLEPRGVYFILVLSSRARRPRTTREVRSSHPRPPSHARSGRGPLAHAPEAPSTCTRCRRPSAAAAQPSDSRALPSLASQARGCSPCACSHRRARLAAGRHTRAESGLGVGSCPRLARCELRGHGCLRAECVRLPDGVCVWS